MNNISSAGNIGKTTSESKLDRIFTVLVFLLPFLYQYRGVVNQLSLGETLLAPFIALYLINDARTRKNKYNVFLLMFYITTVVTTLICGFYDYFILADTATMIIRLVYYGFLICVARNHIDTEYGMKIYKRFAILLAIYLIVQYFYNLITGDYLPIYLKYEWQFPPEARPRRLSNYYMWNFRASSLFLEPSYFALYVLPSILIYFVDSKRKTLKEYAIIIILCVSVVMSQATSGVAGLGIILIVYLFGRNDINKTRDVIVKALTIILVVVSVFSYINKSSDSVLIDRVANGGSYNNRITRGWIVFNELSAWHQLIGVGVNELEPYMNYYELSTEYDEDNLNYCCTMLQTLNFSGILGFLALVAYLVSLRKGIKSRISIGMFWILIFIMCYESIMFTYRFAFYIILIEAFSRSKERDGVKNNKITDKKADYYI